MNLQELKALALKAINDGWDSDYKKLHFVTTPTAILTLIERLESLQRDLAKSKRAVERHDARFREQSERLKRAEEVIKFYASENNWLGYHRYVDSILDDTEPAKASDDFDIQLGGKRAREYLSKYGTKVE